VLTAIGNDYSYEEVFSRQVEAHMRMGDVLWAITTSGNSPNVLRAAEAARRRGAKVLGFTGRNGGLLKDLCDVCFISPAEKTYAIQEIHQLAYHILCEIVDRQAESLGR
jgi:D-sedoheptulose 7-phosphate isomerase